MIKFCITFSKTKGKSERISNQILYVALSQVKTINGLFIVGSFEPPQNKTKTKTDALDELLFMKSEKKLKLSFNNLKEKKGLLIIYQNINSLKTNAKFTLSDEWYNRGDILLFSETLTKKTDNLNRENYKIVFGSVSTNNSRGLICYAKSNVDINCVSSIIDYNEKGHVEIFMLKKE